jgi:hypothetical protein
MKATNYQTIEEFFAFCQLLPSHALVAELEIYTGCSCCGRRLLDCGRYVIPGTTIAKFAGDKRAGCAVFCNHCASVYKEISL